MANYTLSGLFFLVLILDTGNFSIDLIPSKYGATITNALSCSLNNVVILPSVSQLR